jgi:hypothetical protein
VSLWQIKYPAVKINLLPSYSWSQFDFQSWHAVEMEVDPAVTWKPCAKRCEGSAAMRQAFVETVLTQGLGAPPRDSVVSCTGLRSADDRQSPRSWSTDSALGTGMDPPQNRVTSIELDKRLLRLQPCPSPFGSTRNPRSSNETPIIRRPLPLAPPFPHEKVHSGQKFLRRNESSWSSPPRRAYLSLPF